MTQPIQLSFKEIIGYLCHIEQKAPHKTFALYEPKHWVDSNVTIPVSTLRDEAKEMLEFVGLHNYETDIKFAALDDHTGGNISLNDTMEPAVHINVSSTFRNQWNAALAVLAHEICHKFLMVNGLYCSIDVNVNETYVDLATMYVGFGELILNGCDAQVGMMSYKLGYLTMDTYQAAYRLVCSVLGNFSTNHGSCMNNNADLAVNLWRNSDDKKKLMKDCFVEKSQPLSELSRNLVAMEQLISQCKEQLSMNYRSLDKEFFNGLKEKDGVYVDKMNAFNTYYKAYFGLKKDTVTEELNEIFNEALYKAYIACQRHGHVELKREKMVCPSCGAEGKAMKTESGIVKCPKCQCAFYWKADPWNCTSYQRQLDARRRNEEASFDRKVQAEVESRVRTIRERSDAEMENFKKNEMDVCKKTIKKGLPRFYRWLLSDYFD